MADEELPDLKRAKYVHDSGDLPVTEEMMQEFSRDGYIIVKFVAVRPRPLCMRKKLTIQLHLCFTFMFMFHLL